MKLICGNCAEELTKVRDESINITVTSPPYDSLRKYNGNNALWGEHVWKAVIKDLYRVTKQGGVVVWVANDATIKGSETGTSFKQALWAKECGFNLHDTMIWYKTNPMPYIKKDTYTQAFEYMFVFSKGRPKTHNLVRVPSKYAGKVLKTHTTNPESIRKPNKTKPTLDTKIAHNVWEIVVAGTNHGHPAIFPEELVYKHIISWSDEGDTVLDPFMGSGTTGVVCKKTNRNFVGIELSSEYYEIAKERIRNTQQPLL